MSGVAWEIMEVITVGLLPRMGVEGSHTPEDPRLHMRPVEAGRKIVWAACVEELLGVNSLAGWKTHGKTIGIRRFMVYPLVNVYITMVGGN